MKLPQNLPQQERKLLQIKGRMQETLVSIENVKIMVNFINYGICEMEW